MSCRLCGAQTEAGFTTTDRNRACSRERFEYRCCTACGSYLLANVPADLGRYYPADYYGFPEQTSSTKLPCARRRSSS